MLKRKLVESENDSTEPPKKKSGAPARNYVISHEIGKFWSSNNTKQASEVGLNSNDLYKFNCLKCQNTFQAKPAVLKKSAEREANRKNQLSCPGCPHCSENSKSLCGDENCDSCRARSFASVPKSKYWDFERNNGIRPIDVFRSSSQIFWFKCEVCSHIFKSKLNNIVAGQWCPVCGRNK